eukprot:COSAG02_NODE_966_length_15587_cov_19.602376_9_plen_79_part_00
MLVFAIASVAAATVKPFERLLTQFTLRVLYTPLRAAPPTRLSSHHLQNHTGNVPAHAKLFCTGRRLTCFLNLHDYLST